MITEPEQSEVEAIAKAVGFAISEWGQLEHILCSIYAAALRAPVYSIAHASFYSIVSFQAKIKVVDVSFKLAFRNDGNLLEEWGRLKKVARGLSEKRNSLAHGAVRVVYSSPKTVGWFPYWNGTEVSKAYMSNEGLIIPADGIAKNYGSHEIQQMTAEFKAAAAQGNELYQRICEYLHAAGKKWNHDRLD